ncbi:MAG: M20/M25/M40 family metallo-hydrolase, partial [Candidatus Nomurabacteria bacterium]|nr:M20/M25/M40 family metallo-hydrolase [Candidatus Nomurabacteria bacterium]
QTAKVLLQSHVDVVPASVSQFVAKSQRCYGRGVYDMLFAAAAYLHLADELGKCCKNYNIAIMLTGDEELGGMHGSKALLDLGYKSEICVLPDAGEGLGDLSVSSKGVFQTTVTITGRSHHASQPWDGDSAARKLAHFLVEAEKLYDNSDRAGATMTISRLQAGMADNQGPAVASAVLDIRYPSEHHPSDIKASFNSLLKKYNGRANDLMNSPAVQLDISQPPVQRFLEIYRRHVGRDISFSQACGSSDARFFSGCGIPVLMFRPDGGGLHSDNEWLSVRSFEKFYEIIKDFTLGQAKS